MLEVRGLAKRFGSIRAVDYVSFSINTGEVVGLLGPNGAGKTTIMRLINGYFAPDSGEVIVDGISVLERPQDAQHHIGYMPESNPLYKEMLVADFLNLSADLKQIPKAERRAALDFAISSVDIGDVYYRPIGQLSKGFKQRVGIASAVMHKPKILILDEPTEGLDPIQRNEIRALIKDLAREHTIIMSTHVMQEAQAVSDRLLIINKGKVVADGSTQELSRRTGRERIIELDVEGRGIMRALRSINDVDRVDSEKLAEDRIVVSMVMRDTVEIRPRISQLAREREWTIWRLQEQETKLEDIFYDLTKAEKR